VALAADRLPLALAAAGQGANMISEQKQQDQQAGIQIQNIDAQAAKQREADAAVNDQLQAMKQSTPEAERAEAADSFLMSLRRARSQNPQGGALGAVSDRYAMDSAQADQGVQDFGTKTANLMARINAPQLQRQRENVSAARLGQGLNVIGRQASGEDFINQLRTRNVTQNPWIGAGVELAGGVASGMASNGGGGGTKMAKPKTGARTGDYNLTGATRGFA